MSKKRITIKIAEDFASILGSRDVVSELRKRVIKSPAEKISLDFQSVQFVSRSAAYGLLKLKEELFYHKQGQKEIEFINTNKEISQMLRTVASNWAVPKKKPKRREIETTSITSLIE